MSVISNQIIVYSCIMYAILVTVAWRHPTVRSFVLTFHVFLYARSDTLKLWVLFLFVLPPSIPTVSSLLLRIICGETSSFLLSHCRFLQTHLPSTWRVCTWIFITGLLMNSKKCGYIPLIKWKPLYTYLFCKNVTYLLTRTYFYLTLF